MMEERLFEWGEETRKRARKYIAKRKRQLSRLNLVPLSPMESVRPPECTNLEKLWCPDRVFNQRYDWRGLRFFWFNILNRGRRRRDTRKGFLTLVKRFFFNGR